MAHEIKQALEVSIWATSNNSEFIKRQAKEEKEAGVK